MVFIQCIICLVIQLKHLDPDSACTLYIVYFEWMKAADMQLLVNDNLSNLKNWNSSLQYRKNPKEAWFTTYIYTLLTLSP